MKRYAIVQVGDQDNCQLGTPDERIAERRVPYCIEYNAPCLSAYGHKCKIGKTYKELVEEGTKMLCQSMGDFWEEYQDSEKTFLRKHVKAVLEAMGIKEEK